MSKAEPFIQLQEELDIYRTMMTQASKVIVDNGVSEYPIFVAHQQEVELGMPIFKKEENEGAKWSIHASTLEEFVAKQVIFEDKVDEFIANFKSKETSLCIFVLSTLGAQFVFLPSK